MLEWSATRLILALMPTLVAYCYNSTRFNLTSSDALRNATDLQNVETVTKLDRKPSQRDGLDTKDDWYNLTYLFDNGRNANTEGISDQRLQREGDETTEYSKSPGAINVGKRLGRILDLRESLETKKDWYNETDIGAGVTRYMDQVAEKPANDETGYDMYNETGAEGFLTDIELERGFSQHVNLTNEDWYNLWTGFGGDIENDPTLDNISDHQRKGLKTITEDWYNWTDHLGDVRRGTKLKKLLNQEQRLVTNVTWYYSTGVGRDIKVDTNTKLERISNRREVRETKDMKYKAMLPDGLQHYYVPSSTIANFMILYIIQPKHMVFFQHSQNLTVCLREKLRRLDMFSIRFCFRALSGETFMVRWLLRLIGFLVICSVIVLVAVFMLLLCPCLMCWQTSFRRIVQAGKLDTYSNVSWALITIFSSLSMLFALFGVITVGGAGIGLSYYLHSGQMAYNIFATYEEIQAIVLDAENAEKYQHLREVNEIRVRGLCV